MKKAIIAGAASAVLAAMPVVGVFADANFVDQINLKIDNNCSFTRNEVSGQTHAIGTWTTDPSGGITDKLTAPTVTLGQENTLGSSNYKVVCNNVDGYEVTVAATDLSKNTADGDTATASIAYATSTTAGKWYLESNQAGADIANNIVAKETTTTNGTPFVITYKVNPADTQAAGTYTGTASYTFAQL